MTFSLPAPDDPQERALLDDVRDRGWHAVTGEPRPAEQLPVHTYTVGLQLSFGHPELVVVGMGGGTGRGILRAAVGLVAIGTRFEPGEVTDELVHNFDLAIEPVHRGYQRRLLEYADWFYGDDEPWGALQVVWPDARGRFPDEPGYDYAAAPQPLLG